MSWRKCPKCGTNWIEDNKEMCDICAEKERQRIGGNKRTLHTPFPMECVITNEIKTIDNYDEHNTKRTGYVMRIKDTGEEIGVVYDIRPYDSLAGDRAELRFCNEIVDRYQVYHRLSTAVGELSWTTVADNIKANGKMVDIFY